MLVSDSSFSNNGLSAIKMTAGTKMTPRLQLTVDRSRLSNNTGAMVAGGSDTALLTVTMSHCELDSHPGRALHVDDMVGLTLESCNITNNGWNITNDQGFGGAVSVTSSCPPAANSSCLVNLRDTLFSQNAAGPSGTGGAAYIRVEGFSVVVNSSSFVNNTAGLLQHEYSEASGAGAVTISLAVNDLGEKTDAPTDVYIIDSIFTGNSGSMTGAVEVRGIRCVAVSDTSFIDNTSGQTGALSVSGITGDPYSCMQETLYNPSISDYWPFLFHPNFLAGQIGAHAAILSPSPSPDIVNIDIRNTSFMFNVGGSKGALYLEGVQHHTGIANSEFQSNQAADGYGGGVMMTGTAPLSIWSSVFGGNQASDSGGAVYCTTVAANITLGMQYQSQLGSFWWWHCCQGGQSCHQRLEIGLQHSELSRRGCCLLH